MAHWGVRSAATTALVILGTLTAGPLAVSEAAEQAGTVTLAQIEKAWRDRAGRFHSGWIAWKETRQLAQGGVSQKGESTPFSPPAKGPVPDQPLKHTYAREFVFDRGSLRHTGNEPIWDEPTGDFWGGTRVVTFDGQVGMTLRERPNDATFRSEGTVRPDANLILSDLVLQPVLWHFCPESRAIDSLKRHSVTEERGKFDGADCIVLAEKASPAGGGVRRTLWLEPKREFLVRRRISQMAGAVVSQIDVFYRDDPQHGPLPTRWTWLEQTQEGAMRRLVEAEVTRTELNQAIDPGEFRVQFPPGTLVVKQTMEQGELRDNEYLVLRDGAMRPITRAELMRQVTPEMLAATRPGEAGLPEPRGSRTQWIAAIAAFGLTIALVVLWRARKGIKGRQNVSRSAG